MLTSPPKVSPPALPAIALPPIGERARSGSKVRPFSSSAGSSFEHENLQTPDDHHDANFRVEAANVRNLCDENTFHSSAGSLHGSSTSDVAAGRGGCSDSNADVMHAPSRVETSVPPEYRRWDKASEDHIQCIRTKCDLCARQCMDAALFHRRMHGRLAIPAVVVPILSAPLSQLESCDMTDWVKHVNTSIFVLLSLLSAVHTYFDFSRKSEKYMHSSHKYSELVGDIDLELSKPVRFRNNVHTVTVRYKQALASLNKTNWWVTTSGPEKLFRGWG